MQNKTFGELQVEDRVFIISENVTSIHEISNIDNGRLYFNQVIGKPIGTIQLTDSVLSLRSGVCSTFKAFSDESLFLEEIKKLKDENV